MIGIICDRSRGFSRGSHTGNASEASLSIGRSMMGAGHIHWEYTLKNLESRTEGGALGNNLQTYATKMAQLTPPKYPVTLE
jgi:hypothetical protein